MHLCVQRKTVATIELKISQRAIKSELLSSLSFQYQDELTCLVIYNYRYHEVPSSEVWYV